MDLPIDRRLGLHAGVINTLGAFVLALFIVVAADIGCSRYLRPLIGTGFCGAFTTFSSIVVTSDQLFAHRHFGVASAYLAASMLAGRRRSGTEES